ncbi:pentapeptide repeat-containing protein [Nitrosopumilus adriaticus]|uniref:Pentapeptide repeat-containing protein n=1 Tax=Nitrosopumilus adriaticus TaxID=1580092 RepID=A0A0D5C3B2_9ARCH|nr:pentapeptide repeat-containing protein [Nitrosopumilus adriaticus]AJW71048.1 hypothetical protein NADRNF5_1362 [Nitrosopumilus adriaticus]
MGCSYNAKLFSGTYDCPYEEFDHSGFCKFHHPTFWKERKQSHDSQVRDMIKEQLEQHRPLYLVGFHIPLFEWPEIIHAEIHCEFAYFEEAVDFANVYFTTITSFYYTTFEKVVNFQFCDFSETPIFFKTTFKEDAIFVGSKFRMGANFYESIFLQWGNFSSAKFAQSSFMPGMRCHDRINFSSASFEGATNLSRGEFINANFSYVDFHGELDLAYMKFPKINTAKIKTLGYEIPINFDFSTMRQRVRVSGKVNEPVVLEGVSFLGVNLQNFEFNNVKWLSPKRMWRKVIINELMLEKNKNYDDVSDIYAQLRKNYETRLRFTEASNFFIGELECLKKGLQKGSVREKLSSIMYSIHKYLSLYSESYFLPLAVWAPVLILSFLVLRNYTGYCAVSDECHLVGRVTDSLSAFFLFPRSEGLLDVLERVLSIPILGSAFVGLKRKFERRK